MQLTFLRHLRAPRPWRDEHGIVLVVVLIVMVLLLGMGLTSLFSGYTNLLTSTNLKLATQARNTAEAGINEAIYRLSRQEGQPGAIAPDLSNPNWQVQILPTGTPSSTQVASIQDASDWGDYAANTPPVTIRFKKPDPAHPNDVLFIDNSQTPPTFSTIPLPSANIPNTAFPVIQIVATGLDERDAERQILAEVRETTAFGPLAPLSSGVSVNLGGAAFIDGVNHRHDILISTVGSNPIYGEDENSETTKSHSGSQITDSPDDNADTGTNHGIANPNAPAGHDSPPRLFNMQITSSTDAPAWVGLTKVNPDRWTGVNTGYASAVAFSTGPLLLGTPVLSGQVYKKGVFSWGMDNSNAALLNAAPGTGCTGAATLVCRPPELQPFPDFKTYLRLDDVAFQNLLDKPDTCGGLATCSNVLSSSVPPRGFTYVKMASLSAEFNLSSIAEPGTNEFGLLYVDGSLRIPANFVFKGLIFVEGSLTLVGGPTILGAIMVRGATDVNVGAGNATLLYSREAAKRGIHAAHPWGILTWEDTAIQGSTYTE